MTVPSDAVLPPGSLVLVTGANGLVGSEVVSQLLAHGYHVRGTVRDPPKWAWLQEHFDKSYGTGKFELVKVGNMAEVGSLDEAVKGCAGLVHVASVVSFNPDPNQVVPVAVAFTKSALESAAKEPSIKRFVFTSSSSAATQLKLNERFDLTPESWNTQSVEHAWAPPPYDQDRSVHVYSASKVEAERELWKFMEERKPQFVANSVLPDFVCGLPQNVEKQGYPSSIGILQALWNKNEMFKMLYPQYMIDNKDNALLHVGALLHPDYKSERVFGYAHAKTWTDWIARSKKMYPDHDFPDPPENEGADLSNVTGRPRAEALLKWLGRPGWRPMEESMKEVYDSLV